MVERLRSMSQNSIAHLYDRDPQEWLRLLELEEIQPFKHQIAKIIWWDWFSLRPVPKRWPHLDSYLKEDVNQDKLSDRKMRELLSLIGYPEWVINRRTQE
jgi:hypothetical protein